MDTTSATTLPKLSQLIGQPTTVAAPVPTPAAPPRSVLTPPKRQTVMHVRGKKDTTSKVLSALNKRAGRSGAVSSYSRSTQSVQTAVKYIIKTGIHSLDAATGGFPFGKVIEIYGLDSSGKSALAMLVSGSAGQGEIYEIMEDGSHKRVDVPFEVTILYLDNENSLEDGDRLIIYDQEVDCIAGECDTIDQIFKDIETTCDTIAQIQKEDEARAKKDKDYVAPLQFVVVVVDTVAGTTTREEIKQAWDKVDYNRQPIQLRIGFRNTIRRLKEHNLCAVFTNQVSDSFKPKMKGPKTLLPQESDFSAFGGKALRYYATIRIFVCKTPNPYKIGAGKFPDGFLLHFVISKNRLVPPLRQGRMVLMFKNALCQDYTEWRDVIRPQRLEEMVVRERGKGNKTFKIDDAKKFFPEHPPGGYSPVWSMLEHLLYMGFIKYTGTKTYKINFAKYGIQSSLEGLKSDAELEALDTTIENEAGDFEIQSRSEWPPFYQKYPRELAELFSLCVAKMFSQNDGTGGVEADEAAAEEDEDDI